jgi:hypothetical protein
MAMRRLVLVGWLVLLVSSGCEGDACQRSDDCPTGYVCAYYDGEGHCALTCTMDADCDDGQSCVQKGSSCDVCTDLLRICG